MPIEISMSQFRESLTKGKDFSESFDAPTGIVLSIPEGGVTDNELQKALTRLKLKDNAWILLQREAQVSKNRALAHKEVYDAAAAERTAGASYQGLRAAQANLETATANAEIAEFQASVAKAKVPVARAKALVEFETLAEEYVQGVMGLVKARSDRDTQQTILEWQGYEVGHLPRADLTQFPMPRFERPKLDVPAA